MDNCLFCDLKYRKTAYLDNDLFFAVFDVYPVSPGHSLVIPKRHIVDFTNLNAKELKKIHETVHEAILKIETTDLKSVYRKIINSNISKNSVFFCQDALSHPRINTRPDAYNHGINDGKAAGRTIDHLHWHIVPRYEGDVDDPRGGVRFVIPEKGNYKIPI